MIWIHQLWRGEVFGDSGDKMFDNLWKNKKNTGSLLLESPDKLTEEKNALHDKIN